MAELGLGAETCPRPVAVSSRRHLTSRTAIGAALVVILAGNVAAMVYLWWHGGNVAGVHDTGAALTSVARITGLFAAYAALLQVVMLARIPWLERVAGFDRLTKWHRVNGSACIVLVVGHVVFSAWGYAALDHYSLAKEISTMLGGGIYPGMITATVGTGLMILVAVSSAMIVKRRVSYEAWYAVHLAAYAGVALAWFHQIPTGNELVLNQVAADYWRALYAASLALIVGFRVVQPAIQALRYRLRVAEVVSEGAGVVSVRMTGRRLDRLAVRPGQFFLWRFLDRNRWWSAHPFSLSAAPDGRSLRITVKAAGDFTSRLGSLAPGTRVVAEGPLGLFTDVVRTREKALLIAGGIGITPVRAIAEEIDGDVVIVYRVLRDELESLAGRRGLRLEIVAGDHATDEGSRLLSPEHLRQLVPDVAERDVYVCGPPGMAAAIERNVRRTGVPRRQIHAERFAL